MTLPAGSVNARGICPYCGGGVTLTINGITWAHKEHRINRRGEVYTSTTRCVGSGQPPSVGFTGTAPATRTGVRR